MSRSQSATCLAALCAAVAMNSALGADEPPPPPPMPSDPRAQAQQRQFEPEVTIIQRKGAVIEEYRVNGQLRYVKIIPENAPPYYLIDMDGDGSLESRRTEFDNPPINQWILFEW